MSYEQFLDQLEKLLWDISQEERREALEYYKNYFEDAGEENESQVLNELGSPKKVADNLKESLKEEKRSADETTTYSVAKAEKEKNESDKNLKIILLAILAVVAAPVVLPFIFGVVSVIASIVFSIFVVMIALVTASGCIAVAGIFIFFKGCTSLFLSLPQGLFLLGAGLLTFVLGMILAVLLVKTCKIIFPKICHFITNTVQKLFYKVKEAF